MQQLVNQLGTDQDNQQLRAQLWVWSMLYVAIMSDILIINL